MPTPQPETPASPPVGGSSSDRIELMQTFVHIVEAGSLSAAAVQMGATQPTVSRRLQALERSFGVRLLRRSTHAMKLTEDGERCFGHAKELLASWHAFEADLRGAGDEPEGNLRVLVPHAFGQNLLLEPLARYLRAWPRVNVEWLLNDRQPDFIADGVDCAIHVGEVTDPASVAIKLSEIARFVVAAPSLLEGRPLPAHPSELEALPWLALRTFYRTEILLTHSRTGESHRVPIRPRMSTDSLYAVHNFAVMGMGVCAASSWLLAGDIAQGRLVQLVPQWQPAPLPVYLVYPHARFYPARLRRFIEVMRGAMKATV